MQYNTTIKRFIEEKGIDYSFIENNTEAICYNKNDINPIVARFGMYKNKKWENITIDNVIGKDRGKTQNLLNELENLFNKDGDSYKRRSVSMLEYDSKEIVEKLRKSFIKEPVELKEIKQGKYIISNNGMHRINLIRLHYINEMKINKKINIDIQEKYSIKVRIEEIDIVKTYSKYLISLLNKNVLIEDEIDNNYLKTNNVVLYDENDNPEILNYQQLIQYVENMIGKILKSQNKEELAILYETDKYFRDYIDWFKTKNIIIKSLLETEKKENVVWKS